MEAINRLADYIFAHNTKTKVYITVIAHTEEEAWKMLSDLIPGDNSEFFLIDVQDSVYNDEVEI